LYCIQGLIYTVLRVAVHLEVLRYHLVAFLPPENRRGNDSFFSYDHLRDFMYQKFKIRVILEHNGVRFGLPSDFIDDRYPIQTLYLDGIHYNYFGIPVPPSRELEEELPLV